MRNDVDVGTENAHTSSDEIVNDDDILSVPDDAVLHLKCILSQKKPIRSDTRRESSNARFHTPSHTRFACMVQEAFPFSSPARTPRPIAER